MYHAGVGPSKVDRLAELGVRTIDELQATPKASLQKEFGDKVGGTFGSQS